MAGHEEHDPYSRIPPINEGLIIDTLRIEAERQRQEQERRDEEYRQRQARHDRQMLRVTQGLFVATFLTGIAALYQAHASKVSSEAASSAAKTAADTLAHMKESGANSSTQVDRIITKLGTVADSMQQNAVQNKTAMDASEKQSRDALNASIDASHTDQRAWLSLGPTGTILNYRSNSRIGLRFQLINSGKTPALGVTAKAKVIEWTKGSDHPTRVEPIGLTEGSVIAPQNWLTLEISTPFTIAESTFQQLERGEIEYHFSIEITYRDVFRKKRSSSFCSVVKGPKEPNNLTMTCPESQDTMK